MKLILTIVLSFFLVVSGLAQTRNVVVGTNDVIVGPTNFWNANASNGRSGLGLGTAATNSASAFQPSSVTLSNLASNNAVNLTNLQAANLIGIIPTSNIPSTTLTNITGTLAIVSGGTGATNAANARQNLGSTTVGDALFIATNASNARSAVGLGATWLTNTNVTNFRTAIGLGETNALTFQSLSIAGGSLSSAINLGNSVAMFTSTNNQDGVTFVFTGSERAYLGNKGLILYQSGGNLAFGTNNTSGAAITRTNLGLGLPVLTNTNNANFLNDLGVGTNSSPTFDTITTGAGGISVGTAATRFSQSTSGGGAAIGWQGNAQRISFIGGVGMTLEDSGLGIAFGASNTNGAAITRTNLGLGWSALTNTNAATSLLGFTTNGQVVANTTNTLTFTNSAVAFTTEIEIGPDFILTETGELQWGGVSRFSAETMELYAPISFVNNTAATTRTNLGLGATWLTNTNVTNFRNAIGLGTTNNVTFGSVAINIASLGGGPTDTAIRFGTNNVGFYAGGTSSGRLTAAQDGNTIWIIDDVNTVGFGVYYPITFQGGAATTNAAITRTNLGLGWSALTNTSLAGFQAALFGANTNPVLINTNGQVVSPTNFWEVAPIFTKFIDSQPVTNQTTNIPTARDSHIHSLAPSVFETTNTIVLPTNGALVGDIALIVHQGPASSTTAVRVDGDLNNLITLNRLNETVKFIYYNNNWQFDHNASFIQPIYFSGTNDAVNVAISRTNLGLGWSALTNSNAATALIGISTNGIQVNAFGLGSETNTAIKIGSQTNWGFFAQAAPELINVAINGTNVASFTPTGISSSQFTGNVSIASNNTLSFFDTNAAPTNTTNINAWINVQVGTNTFKIPLYK
jgi:hypothetical protein